MNPQLVLLAVRLNNALPQGRNQQSLCCYKAGSARSLCCNVPRNSFKLCELPDTKQDTRGKAAAKQACKSRPYKYMRTFRPTWESHAVETKKLGRHAAFVCLGVGAGEYWFKLSGLQSSSGSRDDMHGKHKPYEHASGSPCEPQFC